MFAETPAFTSFSVNDLAAAQTFYGEQLGLRTSADAMGLSVYTSGNSPIHIYEKQDHQPAQFTVLNFSVPDIDTAISDLAAQGITMIQYNGANGMPPQDESGVLRGRSVGMGPDIAWFNDPAGNILSVLQTDDSH